MLSCTERLKLQRSEEIVAMTETMARADLPRPPALPTLLAARTRPEPSPKSPKEKAAELEAIQEAQGRQPETRLTKERAITLQLELMAAYGTPAFQKELHEIGRRYGTLGLRSKLTRERGQAVLLLAYTMVHNWVHERADTLLRQQNVAGPMCRHVPLLECVWVWWSACMTMARWLRVTQRLEAAGSLNVQRFQGSVIISCAWCSFLHVDACISKDQQQATV